MFLEQRRQGRYLFCCVLYLKILSYPCDEEFLNHRLILIVFFSSEGPIDIIKPLRDLHVTEKEQVMLECEVSKSGLKAAWYKDGQELHDSDRIELTKADTVHRLTIASAEQTDEGKYSVIFGENKSTASVKVEGKNIMIHIHLSKDILLVIKCMFLKESVHFFITYNGLIVHTIRI